MKKLLFPLVLLIAAPTLAVVSISAPINNSNVATTVQYVATSSTSCSKGVAAMGIYTAPNVLAYVVPGAKLNTQLNLKAGRYNTVVQEWDNCGGTSTAPTTIIVSGNSTQVQVTAPANNAKVAGQVQYVALGSTTCSSGIAAIGIYSAPGVLAYVEKGESLNTVLTLAPGNYNTVVQEWDNCGGVAKTPIAITVEGTQSGNVSVTAPTPNSTVAPTVQYLASASTDCPSGVAAIGVYKSAGVLASKVNGSSLNALVTLPAGVNNTVVQEWDNCGGSVAKPITVTVGSSAQSGQFVNLHQQTSGWTGYALLPSLYAICSACVSTGPQTTWSMTPGVASPALSASSSRMNIGGQTIYSDVLWNNHLIGDFSSQNMPDTSRAIAPNLHNFTYDVYFYMTDVSVSQALEFDINQFVNGQSFIWGHECRIAGGNQWDIWDNPGEKWHPTGIPCNPVSNAWNHLVIQVQRTSDNHLLFQSITLNGVTSTLNYEESPTPTSWYGVTINYQQDGNSKQTPYSVWLDKLNFSYW